MKINHSFQINSLLKMIPSPTHTHFLENYFAVVKIKNDHMINKMEDRVKHAVNKLIGKPRVSPLLSLNTSAVIWYLICVYASHYFAGRPYHFNQTLRTAKKFYNGDNR